MRPRPQLAALALLLLTSCHKPAYVVPEAPLPPNTVLLSQTMRRLSAQPGFTEALLQQLADSHNKATALLTPKLIDELRKRILGADWQGLDRFPGWTMAEINPTIHVASRLTGKSTTLEDAAAVHPGTPPAQAQVGQYLDLGPYALDKAETVSLDSPSTLPPFTTTGLVSDLGHGITRGDGPNDLAPEHAESQRLADVLNRLALNGFNGAAVFDAGLLPRAADEKPVLSSKPLDVTRPTTAITFSAGTATTPEALISMLEKAGYSVTVTDTRYFANFGHLHYNGQDVMMPFWVDTNILIPNSGGRHLLTPVTHAELEWHIRGHQTDCAGLCPEINADVSYYFGIDGKAEWRTMDTLDQTWVLKRDAHTYTGADAVEVTRLASILTVAYMHLHAAHPELPYGGYYALGVCQDAVSAIEKKMTGHVTLFPNTADLALFNDPHDFEANGLIAAIPKDRDSKPEPERVFGSLPTAPGADPNQAFKQVTIPGLGDDLSLTYAAWKDGTLERTHTLWDTVRAMVFIFSAVLLAIFFAIKTRHHFDPKPIQRNPYR